MLFSLFIWEQEGKKENFNHTEVLNLIHSKRAALDMLGSCSQLYHYTHPPNCHTHYAPQFLAKTSILTSEWCGLAGVKITKNACM